MFGFIHCFKPKSHGVRSYSQYRVKEVSENLLLQQVLRLREHVMIEYFRIFGFVDLLDLRLQRPRMRFLSVMLEVIAEQVV